MYQGGSSNRHHKITKFAGNGTSHCPTDLQIPIAWNARKSDRPIDHQRGEGVKVVEVAVKQHHRDGEAGSLASHAIHEHHRMLHRALSQFGRKLRQSAAQVVELLRGAVHCPLHRTAVVLAAAHQAAHQAAESIGSINQEINQIRNHSFIF